MKYIYIILFSLLLIVTSFYLTKNTYAYTRSDMQTLHAKDSTDHARYAQAVDSIFDSCYIISKKDYKVIRHIIKNQK